jgi:hypothetical protein
VGKINHTFLSAFLSATETDNKARLIVSALTVLSQSEVDLNISSGLTHSNTIILWVGCVDHMGSTA